MSERAEEYISITQPDDPSTSIESKPSSSTIKPDELSALIEGESNTSAISVDSRPDQTSTAIEPTTDLPPAQEMRKHLSKVVDMFDDLSYWEPLPGETSAEWAAFQFYRNLPPQYRPTLRTAYEAYQKTFDIDHRALCPSWDEYRRMCNRRDWDGRIREFDTQVDAQVQQMLKAQRLLTCAEQAALGRQMREKAQLALDNLDIVKEDDEGNLHSLLSVNELLKLADAGVSIERAALNLQEQSQGGNAGTVNVLIQNMNDGDIRQKAREILENQQGMAETTRELLKDV